MFNMILSKKKNFEFIIFLIIIGLAFFTSMAVASTISNQISNHNEDVLELNSFLQDMSHFSADFEQRSTTVNQWIEISKGSLWLERPGKFRWEVNEPDPIIAVSNGRTVWYYDVLLEQVIVRPLGDEIGQTPALLLSGEIDNLSDIFDVYRFEETIEGSKDIIRYELKNKDNDDGLIDIIELLFVEKQLHAMILTDKLMQTTETSFTNISLPTSFSDDVFELIIPDDVDVIRSN